MDKNRSMVDVAYELMSKKKKAVNFYKLWQEVSEVKGFDEEEKDEKVCNLIICCNGCFISKSAGLCWWNSGFMAQ